MKYDIVAKKETVIQNEIVFLFCFCSQENREGGVRCNRNKESTRIRAACDCKEKEAQKKKI
jgi:hypothetical protein